MPNKRPTRQEILESNPFYDPRFGNQIDESCLFPEQKEILAESDEDELSGVHMSDADRGLDPASELQKFLRNPDNEALEQLARDGSPEAAAELHERIGEQAAREFMKRHPEYLKSERNSRAVVNFLRNNGLVVTLENLERAYKECLRLGALEQRRDMARRLTEADEVFVARLSIDDARAGFVEYLLRTLAEVDAEKLQYLYERYGGHSEQLEEFLATPRLQPLIRKAVVDTWLAGRPDVDPTPDFLARLEDFISRRPALNHYLLDSWFEKFGARETAAAPEEPSTEETESLDDLPDDEIENLMTGVHHIRARE